MSEIEAKFKAASVIGSAIVEGRLVLRVKGFPDIIIDPAKVSAEARTGAMLNGFRQAGMDAAALKRGSSAQEKHEAIHARVAPWLEGRGWVDARTGATGPRFDALQLAAMVEVSGMAEDEVIKLIVTEAEAAKVTEKVYLAKVIDIVPGAKKVLERLTKEAAAKVTVSVDVGKWQKAPRPEGK